MTQLHPLSITNKYLTFENINQLELSNDEYVIASKTKIKKFLKIVSFNETHFITNNENIDNYNEWIFEINSNKSIISNPLVLGHQITCTGEIKENKKIYSLNSNIKVQKNDSKPSFYLNPLESIDYDYIFLGLKLENNIKTLVDIQTFNSKNFIFIHLLPFNSDKKGLKMLKLLEKFKLKNKNLFIEINGAIDRNIINKYTNYFENTLKVKTIIIIHQYLWSENEVFEIFWKFKNFPKIILLNPEENNKLEQFCTSVI